MKSYGPDTDFRYMCTVTLTLEVWPWIKVMTQYSVMDNNCAKILSRSNLAVKSYGPETDFGYVCTDSVILTLVQGHCTPMGHWQQLCEILSRSNLAERSYGLDTDIWYVCTATLTLEIWPWVKVMTHPFGHGQQLCEILFRSDKWEQSYGPDPMWTDERIDRQTDRVISK